MSKKQIGQMPSVLKNWFEGFDDNTEFLVSASRVYLLLNASNEGKHTMEVHSIKIVKEDDE